VITSFSGLSLPCKIRPVPIVTASWKCSSPPQGLRPSVWEPPPYVISSFLLKCFAIISIKCSCFSADSNNDGTANGNDVEGEPMEMDAEQFEDADD